MPASQPELLEQARMMPEPFGLVSKRQDTFDTWTLELAARSGLPLHFSPGQFTMLSAGGCGEVPISISGDPNDPDRLVHTVRAAGLATQAICAAEPGVTMGVRGPFGRPWPLEEGDGCDLVFAAGGIGLPPLRPAIVAALARRERYGRLVLLYGGRAPEQLLYADELAAWSDRGVEVMVTVDSAGPEWRGHVGVVTRLVPRVGLRAEQTVAMCCGPEVMMRFAAAALREAGVGARQLFASVERNMQCGIARCGHCQLGPTLVCRDGPVYRWADLERWLAIREL
jgi:NAD(P)H-flavin reductase